MKKLAALLAHWIVRRPAVVLSIAALIAVVAGGLLTLRQNFDTDILNLLPDEHPAVKGLKIYNTQFTQTRELAFLLTWDTAPDDIEKYRTEFADLLRKQPWAVRILDRPPLENEGHPDEITEIIVPLLLNLPPDQFQQALERLKPAAIEQRITRLAAQTAAGSPRARFELENDPLGLVGLAAKPVWETISISDTFDLTAPDNTAIIVPVITNQSDLSADACRQMMAQVHRFMTEAREKLGQGGPHIGVTGRSPYVEEISQSMNRDIMMTASASLLAVMAIFWVGFRRIVPLVGITLILALTALAAMAVGVAVFSQLNVIAISFCSILFGLGDDFSLLLCQHYFQARADGEDREKAIAGSIYHCMPGMLWVALTTGIGFLALSLSGSAGFAQLGVMVAVGVFLCAIFMPLFLFPFVKKAPPAASQVGPAKWLAERCSKRPFFGVSAVAFGIVILVAFLPWKPLSFDISPGSLEPRNTPASMTLAEMMKRFPATFEPVMVVLPSPSSERLAALNKTLADLKSEGLLESFSTPSGLVLDAKREKENLAALRSQDLAVAATALDQSTEREGLSPLTSAKNLLTSLSKTTDTNASWSAYLPAESAWWFLLDRMVSPSSDSVIAYVKVSKSLAPEKRKVIENRIVSAAPQALVTGWTQTLASLIPWAQRELVVFGSAVAVLVMVVLFLVYRDAGLWVLHIFSIVGAVAGTAATLKLLALPINLLNVLAFPLMLGVGVDYGTHLILAAQQSRENLAGTIKAVTLSGLTTATGFGALILAQNPALAGLGAICGIGVLWCLASSLFIVVPGVAAIGRLAPRRVAE